MVAIHRLHGWRHSGDSIDGPLHPLSSRTISIYDASSEHPPLPDGPGGAHARRGALPLVRTPRATYIRIHLHVYIHTPRPPINSTINPDPHHHHHQPQHHHIRLLSPSPRVHPGAKLEGVSLLLVLCASQLYGGIGCAFFCSTPPACILSRLLRACALGLSPDPSPPPPRHTHTRNRLNTAGIDETNTRAASLSASSSGSGSGSGPAALPRRNSSSQQSLLGGAFAFCLRVT